MVQPGIGLDTPRTNLGDATYLANHTMDFDISPEQSFQSPSKDNNNLVSQLKNSRRGKADLRTPRSRAVLTDRRNLPAGLGGGEFTPLLKSATRNSALRSGKENSTPALSKLRELQDIPEDFSPLPQLGSSIYGRESRNDSYMSGTPAPRIDSSSTASTPMALLPRRTEGPGALQDGNQLSLREQENVIDKIEKENFGLKLKIHFLEEALRKAGPGFSEAALKENTELKVDKVTMQKELHRYRKTLAAAEKDVEMFRQHMLEMQEKSKRKQFDAGHLEELERLRRGLEEKEDQLHKLKGQEQRYDDLEDKIHDLETELREKDRLLDSREDQVDDMKAKVEKQIADISQLQEDLKKAQRHAVELEEDAQASGQLAEAKDIIEELERDLERAKNDAEDSKEERREALKEKERAEADLDELQEEMANKSITTKGLNRQIEEKANRFQDEVEDLKEKNSALEEAHANKSRELTKLLDKVDHVKQDGEIRVQKLQGKLDSLESEKQAASRERATLAAKLETFQKDSQHTADEKNLLQIRHDALTSESAGLQRDLSRSRAIIEDLEDKLDHEKTVALSNEREVRDEYKAEIDRLKDKVEDLESEIREKERMYDADTDKWDSQRRKLESQKEQAEEEAAGLQRTIDKLHEAKGALSGNELKLQQALQSEQQRHQNQETLLTRQITELNEDIQSRSKSFDEVRTELSNVREELRLSQREQRTLSETVEGLEDEVEILQASLDEETDRSNQEISAAKHELESLRRQVHILKQDLSKAESATADAQAEIDAFQGDLRAGKGSNEQLNSRLRDVETQLSKLRAEKRELKEQLSTITNEVYALRRSKSNAEAERNELQSQLDTLKQQDDETFRLDQERVELRASKLKLDGELRRLREETRIAVASQQTLEKELQGELDRATAEESRLNSEIQDLQRILRGSSEKRELATARKTIQQLEARIQELTDQIALSDERTDAVNELSIMRRDLSTARQKEMEYLQREASHKDAVRGLKRQVTDLERKAHDADVSRIAAVSPSPSPRSSVGDSARKSELVESRKLLSVAQETIKTLRTQLKDALKDSARKLNAADSEFRERYESWESEKDQLERSLDDVLLKTEELVAQNKTSESTIKRLRAKIERLEKALQTERLNHGEDRTIANERHDLHEMLRESQVHVESLQVLIKERDSTIRTINKSYSRLNEYAAKVQDQRNKLRVKDVSSNKQVETLQRKIQESTEAWEAEKESLIERNQQAIVRERNVSSSKMRLEELQRKFEVARENWEVEKLTLTRGVRFANMSVSDHGDEIEIVKKAFDEREHMYIKLQRGLKLQVDWWRAKCEREAMFRDMGAFAKQYMGSQIEMYTTRNKLTIDKLKTIPGVKCIHRVHPKPPITIRKVAHMFRAIFRMKLGVKEWAKHLVVKQALLEKIEEQKNQKLAENPKAKVQSNTAGLTAEVKTASLPSKPVNTSPSKIAKETKARTTSKQVEITQDSITDNWLAEAEAEAESTPKQTRTTRSQTTHDWQAEAKTTAKQTEVTESQATHDWLAQAKTTSKDTGVTQTQTTRDWLAEAEAYLSEAQTDLSEDKVVTIDMTGFSHIQNTDDWMADADAHLTETETQLSDSTREVTMTKLVSDETLERIKKHIEASETAPKEIEQIVNEHVKGTAKESVQETVQEQAEESFEEHKSHRPSSDDTDGDVQIRIDIRLPKSHFGSAPKESDVTIHIPAKYRADVEAIMAEEPEAMSKKSALDRGRVTIRKRVRTHSSTRNDGVTVEKTRKTSTIAEEDDSEFDVSKPLERLSPKTTTESTATKPVQRKSSRTSKRRSSTTATQSDLARLIAAKKAAEAGYDVKGSPPKRTASRKVTG